MEIEEKRYLKNNERRKMKIRYYVTQSFSGIEEIDTDSLQYRDCFKQWYDYKTCRCYNFNLVFNKRKEALEYCLGKLKENRDEAYREAEIQTDKIAKFLIKYEGEI